ncbi:DUF3857 domain-containing protein [Sphingomonas sp. KRR8]|uniref:DUF3857 domain-containing protein n=1 Tax=Sphingomonas sp. KRR8 TaxID=2942996 RepID=UPI0020223E14|nr:DUF3857 domain-containing protein [Sphingomonas sp. KRR8]URD60723.1 DUF3857 domain-containing protein [Sphingomonas sp. KRR8]
MRNLRYLLLLGVFGLDPAMGQGQAVLTEVAAAKPDNRRPLVGPAPSWALKADIPPAPAATEGAASVNVLADRQVRFSHEGMLSYVDFARKIMTPQGLPDGALQVGWDPSLEKITFHSYRIIRDGQPIDLLGDGSKLTIVQREEKMEDAALDGELTASLQPSDLRVGDIVEYSYTRERHDPALGGHSEILTGPADGANYGRFRNRLIWPADVKMNWRKLPGVLNPTLTKTALGNELLIDLRAVRTPLPPEAAPARFRAVNAVDLSDFADWRSVAQTILPFYTKAATLAPNSEVKVQARKIAATTTDPRRRAELALALVQDQVRYLFLGMDDGGYIPAAADLTWSRRFGDCKGKTVLLVALLRELGIAAEPVLVHTESGDFVRTRLPAMGSFDHVIVRATVAGGTYWLDGTRLGDTRLEFLRTPPYHVGLPVSPTSAGLVPMEPEPLTEPSETLSLDLDSSAGIEVPAIASGEMRFRGMSGTDMRVKYSGLSPADQQQQLRDLWRKNYDFVSPVTITTATDPKTGDFLVTMRGTAKMDWYTDADARWYELDRARLGWKFDTDRTNMVNADAPFALDYPDYWESRETIKLPHDGEGFRLQQEPIDQEVQGIYAMHRKVAISGGLVTMEASTRALAPELPIAHAEQARTELAALRLKGAYVRVPDDYTATEADIAALQSDKPALAQALLHRGAVRYDRGDYKASLTDEDAAIALDPKLAAAHAVRALALSMMNDPRAGPAADTALALDPKQTLALRARVNLANTQKRYADEEVGLTQLLALEPGDASLFLSRSGIRLLRGNFSGALADADEGIAIKPSSLLWMARSAALTGLERMDEALADSDRAVSSDPDNRTAREVRAELRQAAGKRALAVNDLDELIRRWPSASHYLSRAQLRLPTESALRDADVAAAMKIDPQSQQAVLLHGLYAVEGGNLASATADVAKLQQLKASDGEIIQLRTRILEKQGRSTELVQLLDAYVARHPRDATALNQRCWAKATHNISMNTALDDCESSLKLRPNSPATLDSRGFVRLRLGQNAAAISDYDAALKLAPKMEASLYGRAIAKARLGDMAGARADLALARSQNGEVEKRFQGYGIELPTELRSAITGVEANTANTN